jgi:hypothetical protein
MKKLLLPLLLISSLAIASNSRADEIDDLNDKIDQLQSNIDDLQDDLDNSTIIRTEPVYVDHPVYIDRPGYVEKTVPAAQDNGRTPGKDGRPSQHQIAQWHANLRSHNAIVRKQASEALKIWEPCS